jgi:hypothetical protein
MPCFDWLPFSVPYRSCAWLGEVWNLGIRPVVSTGLVLRSLSANHMPCMGKVLLVGESFMIMKQSVPHEPTLLIWRSASASVVCDGLVSFCLLVSFGISVSGV